MAAEDCCPAWSPDGSRIAYTSRATGSDELYVYEIASATSTQITHGGNVLIYKQRPTWSPDSRRFVFDSWTGHFELAIMNADGSEKWPILQSAAAIRV